jgi:hypothetical protein
LESVSPSQRANEIITIPISKRPPKIRELRKLEPTDSAATLATLLNTSLDANSTTTAIKMLGAIGTAENVDTLLRHYDTYRTAVTKSLVAIGVFDEILPTDPRERRMFHVALNHADPKLVDLIRDGRVTRDTIRSVLPPMM